MKTLLNLEGAKELDKKDPLLAFREQFHIPKINGDAQYIYLAGNSLGLQPKITKDYIIQELDDWANLGVEGHFMAKNPWMPYHSLLNERMSKLVGALPSETVVMNSLTVNLHLLMVSFYKPTKHKFKIIIEDGAFPSDDYAVQSQSRFHGFDPSIAIIRLKPKEGQIFSEGEVEEQIKIHGEETALILWGGVNYRTGQAFDLKSIATIGKKYNAAVGFDLAHLVGNIPCYLHDSGADFAAWCSYKYLNSGPGSLAAIFIHEKHHGQINHQRFEGWWGHDQNTRFKMKPQFVPMKTAEAWQLSNPTILSMAAIHASLELFEKAGMESLRQKSLLLTAYLEYLIKKIDTNGMIMIQTPSDPKQRGCQLSMAIKGIDKSIIEKLMKKGIIADWREPNILRIAPVPLYNTFVDIWNFSEQLSSLLNEK